MVMGGTTNLCFRFPGQTVFKRYRFPRTVPLGHLCLCWRAGCGGQAALKLILYDDPQWVRDFGQMPKQSFNTGRGIIG
jgi:hypothetical protein